MARSDIPKPDKLEIELHDMHGNVKDADWLRYSLQRFVNLKENQIKIVERKHADLGYEWTQYSITSTKNVSFARWEVCAAFCDGLRGY